MRQMDYNEIRDELGHMIGKMHFAAYEAASAATLETGYRQGCAYACEKAAQMVVELVRKLDAEQDKTLMQIAEEHYEKSEKDCMWEGKE